jgi:chemotaxis protein MotB
LVSYADFITLMFAFFVVMYSAAQVDKRKVGQLAMAIQVAFQKMGVFPASTTQVPLNTLEPMPFDKVQAIASAKRTTSYGKEVPSPSGSLTGSEENGDLGTLQRELQQALGKEIEHNEVALRSAPDGIVISLREIGFFESGSAAVRPNSQFAFQKIAALLVSRNCRVRIEGHTDNVPISNGQFHSNWELSTARATELVRVLITQYDFSPARLSAAGYAEYHPVAGNETPQGRAQNRRVDIVILGKTPPNSLPAP